METEWRKIPGFENYECSVVDGSIRSVDRYREYYGGRGNVFHRQFVRGKTIIPQLQTDGKHYGVRLSKNGKSTGYTIQQLVALTYPEICGAWFEGAIAHHIDGDPSNNTPTNIKVISRQKHIEEHWETIDKQLNRFQKGSKSWNTRDILVYTTDFEVIGLFHSNREVSEVLGCSQPLVSANCLGKKGPIHGKFYCEYL